MKKKSNKRKLNKYLKIIHRYVGFPIAILFFVTAITGFLNGTETLWYSLDAKNQTYKEVPLSHQAAVIEQIFDGHTQLRSLTLPTTMKPYYLASGRGFKETYSIDGALISSEQSSQNDFFSVVLRLHRNLLLGREGIFSISGSKLVAWISLLALAISLIGLWIWWPIKKTFKKKNIVPQKMTRPYLFQSHMTAGVVTLFFIVVLGLTGAGIVYRGIAQQVLGAEGPNNEGLNSVPIYTQPSWYNWLIQAQQAIGEGQLHSIAPTRARNNPLLSSAIEFRFVTPSDWLSVPNSKIYINTESSNLIGVQAFSDLSFGRKVYAMMLPLHTGRNTSSLYLATVLIGTCLTFIMAFSGMISFIKKKRNYKTLAINTLNSLEPPSVVTGPR